jgi:hypothetical protein
MRRRHDPSSRSRAVIIRWACSMSTPGINLTTAYATPLGTFDESVVDIAIPLKQ